MGRLITMCVGAIISFLLFSSILSGIAHSTETIFFTDDFEDGNASDWTIFPNSTIWNIQTINGSKQFGSLTNKPIEEAQNGDYNWTDYEFSVDITPINNFDRNIFFRATETRVPFANLTFPIGYGLHMSPDFIDLQKYTTSIGSSPDIPGKRYYIPVSKPWENNTRRKIKIQVKSNNIKVYYDDIDTPVLEYEDNNSPILSGRISLVHASGISGHSEVYFDNVVVKAIPPDEPALPSLDVVHLSQKDTRWATELYDHAQNADWSQGYEGIGSWGCALTSAAMVLKYHGHNVDPKILNNWLKSQPDGYIGNGLINWLAISRYTNINKAPSSPALLFRKLTPTNENIIFELTAGRPAILDVNEHFVVAKSQTSDSFGINDPITTVTSSEFLTKYGNSFKIINSYVPTFTDLSYILLVTNTPNIQFYGTDGNPVNGVLYEEGKIKLDEDGITGDNGQKLYTIMLPEPLNGTYKLELSGTGDYFLKYFAYDTQGNPQLFDANGTFNGIQKYDINYGDVSGLVHTNPPVVEKLTMSDLIKTWDEGYRNGKIKKQIYFMVRFELLWAKYYENRGWEKHLERRLNTISIQIRHMPNKLVNSDFSLEFRNLIAKYLKQ